MTSEERRAFYRKLIAEWEINAQRQRQLDSEADVRALRHGILEEPGR